MSDYQCLIIHTGGSSLYFSYQNFKGTDGRGTEGKSEFAPACYQMGIDLALKSLNLRAALCFALFNEPLHQQVYAVLHPVKVGCSGELLHHCIFTVEIGILPQYGQRNAPI